MLGLWCHHSVVGVGSYYTYFPVLSFLKKVIQVINSAVLQSEPTVHYRSRGDSDVRGFPVILKNPQKKPHRPCMENEVSLD